MVMYNLKIGVQRALTKHLRIRATFKSAQLLSVQRTLQGLAERPQRLADGPAPMDNEPPCPLVRYLPSRQSSKPSDGLSKHAKYRIDLALRQLE